VDRPTWRSLAIFAGLSPAASSLRAVSILSGVIAAFRPPPFPPLARAAAKPAMVRSFTNSLSISATEARMWNSRRPEGVAVSNPSVRVALTANINGRPGFAPQARAERAHETSVGGFVCQHGPIEVARFVCTGSRLGQVDRRWLIMPRREAAGGSSAGRACDRQLFWTGAQETHPRSASLAIRANGPAVISGASAAPQR